MKIGYVTGSGAGGRWLGRLAATVAALAAQGAPAMAHEAVPGVSGFASLVLHPLVAVDTVLVIVGLGIVAGATERPMAILISLPAALAAATGGALLQSKALLVPGLWRLPLIVAIALGGLAAAAPLIGRATCLAASVAASLTVGLALAPERPGLFGLIEAGAAATGAVLIGLGAVGLPRALAPHPASRLAGRVAGAWIAAIAALGLSVSLR